MSFLAHFRLRGYPFQITADHSTFVPFAAHSALLKSVIFAIERGSGIVKISGDVGTGKTVLGRLLLEYYGSKLATAYIPNPPVESADLVRTVCHELGIEPDGGVDPQTALTSFLLEKAQAGDKLLLIIDEAQTLGEQGLERVRLLSNIDTTQRRLLQIILLGQPELDELLSRHSLRQLRQRISFSFRTVALTPQEVDRYLHARIARFAHDKPPRRIFAPAAVRVIASASRGIPRIINLVADKALLAAYSDGRYEVTRQDARDAAKETAATVGPRWRWRMVLSRYGLGGMIGAVAALVVGSLALWSVSMAATPGTGPGLMGGVTEAARQVGSLLGTIVHTVLPGGSGA
jgi:MSHA biogenesis protein MshM